MIRLIFLFLISSAALAQSPQRPFKRTFLFNLELLDALQCGDEILDEHPGTAKVEKVEYTSSIGTHRFYEIKGEDFIIECVNANIKKLPKYYDFVHDDLKLRIIEKRGLSWNNILYDAQKNDRHSKPKSITVAARGEGPTYYFFDEKREYLFSADHNNFEPLKTYGVFEEPTDDGIFEIEVFKGQIELIKNSIDLSLRSGPYSSLSPLRFYAGACVFEFINQFPYHPSEAEWVRNGVWIKNSLRLSTYFFVETELFNITNYTKLTKEDFLEFVETNITPENCMSLESY